MPPAFRFAILLELRESQRDRIASQLVEISAAAADLQQQRGQIAANRTALRQRRLDIRRGVISASTIKSHDDYDVALAAADRQLARQAAVLDSQQESCHQQLVIAQQEVEKLAKLRELDANRHHTQLVRQQQHEQDSLVTSRIAWSRHQRYA